MCCCLHECFQIHMKSDSRNNLYSSFFYNLLPLVEESIKMNVRVYVCFAAWKQTLTCMMWKTFFTPISLSFSVLFCGEMFTQRFKCVFGYNLTLLTSFSMSWQLDRCCRTGMHTTNWTHTAVLLLKYLFFSYLQFRNFPYTLC